MRLGVDGMTGDKPHSLRTIWHRRQLAFPWGSSLRPRVVGGDGGVSRRIRKRLGRVRKVRIEGPREEYPF